MAIIKANDLIDGIEYGNCAARVKTIIDSIMASLEGVTNHNIYTHNISSLVGDEVDELETILKNLGYRCKVIGDNVEIVW